MDNDPMVKIETDNPEARYHRPKCRWLLSVVLKNPVVDRRRSECIRDGHPACKRCKP